MDRVIFHEQESWARENTPDALASAIEKLSEQDLRSLGQGASRLAEERYAWSRVFERFFCIYREVCSKYKRSRPG